MNVRRCQRRRRSSRRVPRAPEGPRGRAHGPRRPGSRIVTGVRRWRPRRDGRTWSRARAPGCPRARCAISRRAAGMLRPSGCSIRAARVLEARGEPHLPPRAQNNKAGWSATAGTATARLKPSSGRGNWRVRRRPGRDGEISAPPLASGSCAPTNFVCRKPNRRSRRLRRGRRAAADTAQSRRARTGALPFLAVQARGGGNRDRRADGLVTRRSCGVETSALLARTRAASGDLRGALAAGSDAVDRARDVVSPCHVCGVPQHGDCSAPRGRRRANETRGDATLRTAAAGHLPLTAFVRGVCSLPRQDSHRSP